MAWNFSPERVPEKAPHPMDMQIGYPENAMDQWTSMEIDMRSRYALTVFPP